MSVIRNGIQKTEPSWWAGDYHIKTKAKDDLRIEDWVTKLLELHVLSDIEVYEFNISNWELVKAKPRIFNKI